jgi:ribosome-associated heat shock protein Hsp15
MISSKAGDKTLEEVRIDRWLWAARFFKSRTLAAKACIGGKVDINGKGAKSHKSVKPGDLIEFMVGDWERKVKVLMLAERRGPAAAARLLYEDLSPPPPSKTDFLFSPTPSRPKGAGRPTKREGRKLRKLKGD